MLRPEFVRAPSSNGRAALLQGTQALALCRNAAARPLSDCLDSVDSPEGRRRVVQFLETQPYPHYEPSQDSPGLLVRLGADGTRTLGRFVNRGSWNIQTA